MSKMTVAQIADKYGVSKVSVGNWIKKGLPYEIEKKIGRKPRKVIDSNEVDRFFGLKNDE